MMYDEHVYCGRCGFKLEERKPYEYDRKTGKGLRNKSCPLWDIVPRRDSSGLIRGPLHDIAHEDEDGYTK